MWEWMGLTGYGLRSMPEAAPYQTTRHKKGRSKWRPFSVKNFSNTHLGLIHCSV